MKANKTRKPVVAAMGAAMAGSLLVAGAVNAAENPFGLSELGGGYMQLASSHMEGKCGGAKPETAEGKCGGAQPAEGKCGGAQPAEGKCGGAKPAEGKCGGEKPAEGKCGEGKCGGQK
jgi:uncharacterized low-complexity protein